MTLGRVEGGVEIKTKIILEAFDWLFDWVGEREREREREGEREGEWGDGELDTSKIL
jgi:hypothetical protein